MFPIEIGVFWAKSWLTRKNKKHSRRENKNIEDKEQEKVIWGFVFLAKRKNKEFLKIIYS